MVIPNLNPPLIVDEKQNYSRLIQRLVHLTKYSNVQQLDNLDAASPLSQKLIEELFGISQDYEPVTGLAIGSILLGSVNLASDEHY
jgi:hypothetical protein